MPDTRRRVGSAGQSAHHELVRQHDVPRLALQRPHDKVTRKLAFEVLASHYRGLG